MRLFVRFGVVAVAVAIVSPASAQSECVGVAAGAIGARFSQAAAACGGSDSKRRGTVRTSASITELPRSVSIAFPGTAPATIARARVAARSLTPNAHHATVVAVANRYRIDPALLHAIINQESGYKMTARSSKGALGLMQLMPGTARGLGVRDVSQLTRDPVLNLSAGAAYLKQLQSELGNDVPRVLAAYNAGPGAVRRYKGIPPYRETRNYVGTIMSRYGRGRARR